MYLERYTVDVVVDVNTNVPADFEPDADPRYRAQEWLLHVIDAYSVLIPDAVDRDGVKLPKASRP